ncbi:MAG: DinB family protein [Planctomycetes bacterium]|nr:DinB family protein [Planctomycetota bacterium]
MSPISRPERSEYATYYGGYVDLVPEGDVLAQLRCLGVATLDLLESLDDVRAAHRYAPGKWSIKQLLGHVIDGERVFAHRALAIARQDPADQPSMEQDDWMAAVDFDRRSWASLVAEYRAVRAATLALFESFDAETSLRRGRASGNPFTVRALVYVVAGHELHHLRVLRERYGVG